MLLDLTHPLFTPVFFIIFATTFTLVWAKNSTFHLKIFYKILLNIYLLFATSFFLFGVSTYIFSEKLFCSDQGLLNKLCLKGLVYDVGYTATFLGALLLTGILIASLSSGVYRYVSVIITFYSGIVASLLIFTTTDGFFGKELDFYLAGFLFLSVATGTVVLSGMTFVAVRAFKFFKRMFRS